ncbi:Ubiquitin-conjugating enzyme [Aspergillus sp. HF37]|nr:Ubiquitin-conjugating enzyme [Aspergillus sp. HF37]
MTYVPTDGLLILAHAPVPEQDMVMFLATGAPPKGFLFINFIDVSQGHSLIPENDLELVDRPLKMGCRVKRHPDDTVSGTVVSTSKKCTLELIVSRECDPVTEECGPLNFTAETATQRGSSTKRDDAPRLLYDVPLSDIKYFEEFPEGDYVVYQQKLGIVVEVVRDMVLRLPNETVVSIEDPLSLHRPLSTDSTAIVSPPLRPNALKFMPLENGQMLWSIEAPVFHPGDFVLTSKGALKKGDWISGAYSDSENPGGHVLATPASSICVTWVCPNTFAPGEQYHRRENDYFSPETLLRHAKRCDNGKLPSDSNGRTVKADNWFSPGDNVRFRDPARAAVKYPQYQHIPADQTFGHDLNIFRIVSMKSQFTVRWQDLGVTVEDGASLHKFVPPRDEFWPGSFVTLREGIEYTDMPRDAGHGPSPGIFEGCSCRMLCLKKTGVVQAVDSRERIASVRWYKEPDIRLLHGGSMWEPSSVLGELCDQPTEVSLYELTSFPGLSRPLNDLVILTPEKIQQSVIASADMSRAPAVAGPTVLNMLAPLTFSKTCSFLQYIRNRLAGMDWFKNSVEIDSTPLPARHSIQRQHMGVKGPADFVGHVISVDIDGTVTVRLVALDECRDVRVPLEKILLIVDYLPALSPLALPGMDEINVFDPFGPFGGIGPEPPVPDFHDFDGLDDAWIDDELSADMSVGAIAPDIEHRLDDDSADDSWETEDDLYEDEDMLDDDDMPDLEMTVPAGRPYVIANGPEVAEIHHPTGPDGSDSDENGDTPKDAGQAGGENTKLPNPKSNQPPSCPENFAIMDSDPASDHRFLSKPASESSGVRIKRIRKEYKILASSLPSGIFVRSWESRLDLFRVLIIGPQGTSYEYAPFVIDFHFPDTYPSAPPESYFHSWTNGLGVINPNLYENGTICLSILGTWPGKDVDEGWSSIKSTVLQVLVSIMGLVLVKTPFYNEAGYEALAAEGGRRVESGQYTEKIFLLARNFIRHALPNPVAGFEDVLSWNYLASPVKDDKTERPRLLRLAIDSALSMIEHHNNTAGKASEDAASPFVSRLSLGAVVMLRKHVAALEEVETDSDGEIS